MEDVTHISQKKTYLKQGTAKVDEDITIYMKPEDAVLLSPSLGMPAIVKKEKGKAVLELIILAKTDKLQKGSVAYHLRWLPWAGKDKALNVSLDDTIFKAFLKDKKRSMFPNLIRQNPKVSVPVIWGRTSKTRISN